MKDVHHICLEEIIHNDFNISFFFSNILLALWKKIKITEKVD